MIIYLVLSLDLVLQLIAACLALRLIRITGRKSAWSLLTLAIIAMAVNRFLRLCYNIAFGAQQIDLIDIIHLMIACLMVAGVAFIGPVFRYFKTNEEKLRLSEEKYRTIVETAHEGIAVTDAQNRLVYANPRLLDISGYRAVEMLGRSPLDFLAAEEKEKAQILLRDGKREGKGIQEFRALRKDGSSHWISITHSGIVDQQGGYLGGVDLVNDITVRKHAEEALTVRSRQQEAVARLGLTAIGGADLTVLFDSAANLVSQNLQVQCCGVLEPWPTRDSWRLRAGVGWHPEVLGTTVMAADPESLACYTLRVAQPVTIEDLGTETRFSCSPLLRMHGVVSGLNVIIAGDPEPFGLLGAYTTRARNFSRDDINFLQSMANVLAGAVAHRRAEQELQQSEQRLRFLASQLLISQEQERGKLSMELHEELGQALQALKLQTGAIKKGLQEHQSGLGQECEALAGQLVQLIDRLRGLSWELSPHSIEDLGLGAALRQLIDDFKQHYQINSVQMELEEVDELFTQPEKITLFRIVQGALSNIGEHAEATRVTLNLERKPGGLSLVITDDGKGFETEEVLTRQGGAKGFGLYAMEERVKMLGGALMIKSRPSVGTELTFNLPRLSSG